MSNKYKPIFDSILYNFIKNNYTTTDRLARNISYNITPSKLCKGYKKLVTPYDKQVFIPYLATQLGIDFKVSSNGKVNKSCKLCELVITKLQLESYLQLFNKMQK